MTLHVFYRSRDGRHVFYDRTMEAVMRRGETRAPWTIGFGGNETAKPIRTGRVEGHARKALRRVLPSAPSTRRFFLTHAIYGVTCTI